MSFSAKEIRLLVDMERRMDSGEVPFIYVKGSEQRCSMDPAHMAALGLTKGQIVSIDLWIEILKFKIEQCDRAMAHKQVQEVLDDEPST